MTDSQNKKRHDFRIIHNAMEMYNFNNKLNFS